DFVWTTDVGSIDATGLFTAQSTAALGSVTATNGTFSGSATVDVVDVTLDHIIVLPDPATVIMGQNLMFTATAYDQFNNVISGIDFTWTTDVGIIDATGFFTAQFAQGTGIVNATNGTVTGTAMVTVTLYSFQIDLNAGWNLISFPLELSNTSVTSVLSTIDGLWDYVQYYDATDANDHWKTYATFKPPVLNDLSDLNNTMGFWLHMLSAATLTVYGIPPSSTNITLYVGWNLVGYPTFNTTTTVSDALAGTGYDGVEGFNASAPYLISPLPDTYVMTPGEGYWVHVPSDVVWQVTNQPPDTGVMSMNDSPPGSRGLTVSDQPATAQPPVVDTEYRQLSQGEHALGGISSGTLTLLLLGLLILVYSLRLRKRKKTNHRS
ncbi:MAG: hypothetical protein KAX31_04130, partial [Thermoplasmata archaeon]|nr:hypothetical protein [Thermoplasmata archaeon]